MREGKAEPRTQASIAVSADGKRWILLDCAPEILAQLARTPELHPRDLRHSPIEAIVLTGGDVDHVAGLLSLREGTPFTLWATPSLHGTLEQNAIFNVLKEGVVSRKPLLLDTAFELPGGIVARAFAVPGKAALYQPGEGEGIGRESDTTIGIELTAGGRRCYYIPGCAHLSARLAERIQGADLVLFDGTLWSDDELITHGLGHKSGARMGHMSMSGMNGSIASLAGLELKRQVFVHINNSNPVLLDDSEERAQAEAAGWEIAHDGMTLTL